MIYNYFYSTFFSPECTKKTVDLVFLFDGSGSMKEEEFQKNKDFIEDIMNNLKNTSIKVTAPLQHESVHRILSVELYTHTPFI